MLCRQVFGLYFALHTQIYLAAVQDLQRKSSVLHEVFIQVAHPYLLGLDLTKDSLALLVFFEVLLREGVEGEDLLLLALLHLHHHTVAGNVYQLVWVLLAMLLSGNAVAVDSYLRVFQFNGVYSHL